MENTVGAIARAVGYKGNLGRCENLAQLAVEVGKLLESTSGKISMNLHDEASCTRFILVFDGIDGQRDAPPTLMPALARLGEIVSCSSLLKSTSLTI